MDMNVSVCQGGFTGTLRTTLDPPMGMRVSIRLHPAMHTHLVYTLYDFLPYIENGQNTHKTVTNDGKDIKCGERERSISSRIGQHSSERG